MVTLTLKHEEAQILTNLVEHCLMDLRDEIRRTENFEYKMMLELREQILRKLLAQLRKSQMPVAES